MAKDPGELELVKAQAARLEERVALMEARARETGAMLTDVATQRDRETLRANQLHAQLRAIIETLALIATGAHTQLDDVQRQHRAADIAAGCKDGR